MLNSPEDQGRVSSVGNGSTSARPPDQLAEATVLALAISVFCESQMHRHRALLERTRATLAEAAVVRDGMADARAYREAATAARTTLREAISAEVAQLKRALVPPERVLRMLRDGLTDAVRADHGRLSSVQIDDMRNNIMQWAIADYFAVA